MTDKIQYPYYGKTTKGLYFVITAPKNVAVLQHNGTYGFGFSVFISRAKVLNLFKFSKEITKIEFQNKTKNEFEKFLKRISENSISLNAKPDLKLIEG